MNDELSSWVLGVGVIVCLYSFFKKKSLQGESIKLARLPYVPTPQEQKEREKKIEFYSQSFRFLRIHAIK